MPCVIECENDYIPDQDVRQKIETWANYNRFKYICVTEKAEIILDDRYVKLTSKAWQMDSNGVHRIPFKIISAKDVQFTCAYDDANALKESFPTQITKKLLFAVGKMPAGVKDLSFFGDFNTNNEHMLEHVVITSNRGLENLTGCPQFVKSVEISRNSDLVSLKGITKKIDAELFISMNPKLTSFHNIHHHISSIGSHIIIDGCVQKDILGLLLIEGLSSVLIDHNDGRSPSKELSQAINILNKYLKEPPSSHRLFDCYEEMLESGLAKYARL